MDEEIIIRDLIAEDMDGDGDMDIVAALTTNNTIAWYENDGNADPTWTAANLTTNYYDTHQGYFAEDMDGDGDMDLVWPLTMVILFRWHENDGNADPTWTTIDVSVSFQMAHQMSNCSRY